MGSQVGDNKWRSALMRRKERIEQEIELKRREDEELKKMRSSVEAKRQMNSMFPILSREALIKEKQEKVQALKRQKMQLKMKVKADQARRKSEQQTWLYMIKQIRNMQEIAKEEKELEKMRELEAAEEKRRQYKLQLEDERKLQKLKDKEWEKSMVTKVKKGMAKRQRKRKEEQKHNEENTQMFVSRFRKLQLEAKKRKQREKMRELQEEEKRLQEKKKRQEKELVRRAEVTARLEHAYKCQTLGDEKRAASMDRVRLQHEAECAVYESQKQMMQQTLEQIKQHDAKLRRQREDNAREKLERERELKRRQEVSRRVAVCSAVSKYRTRARAIAARRARQLAFEETEWRVRQQHNKLFNTRVRAHWSRRVGQSRVRETQKLARDQRRAEEQQVRQKEMEVARRERVMRRIQRRKNQRKVSAPPNVSLDSLQNMRKLMHQEHTRKMLALQSARDHAAQLAREQSRAAIDKYRQEREQELQSLRNNKHQVHKKATQKVWR